VSVERIGWMAGACIGMGIIVLGIRAIAIGRLPAWLMRLRRTAKPRLAGASIVVVGVGGTLRGVTELVGVQVGFIAFLIMLSGFVIGWVAESWPPPKDLGHDARSGDGLEPERERPCRSSAEAPGV
jgi:multisubunit Na+/H+ antiporter MnhG subunit